MEEADMEELIDENYARRGWRVKTALWVTTLVVFAVAFYKGWVGVDYSWLWIIMFIGLWFFGLLLEWRLKRTYRCPRCGTLLGTPRIRQDGNKQEYVHDCEMCRVTWRTRTYVPDDGG